MLAALALVVGATAARAGLPSPETSFVPARLVVCPAGDSAFVVVARHLSDDPWFEGPVWVEVCDCAGFRLSSVPPACAFPDTSHCDAAMEPDPLGVVEIPVSGGGLCPGGSVRVFAGGVLLRTLSEPACFDQNGDLRVDDADVAIVESKLGTADPGADFDGDGIVTAADLAILHAHLGHASPDAPTPPAGVTTRRAP